MNRLQRFQAAAFYYPTLGFTRAMVLAGIWRAYDWVDEHVAIGGRPTRATLRRLAGHGVRRVINLCQEYAGDSATLDALGLTQLHLPTIDYQAPSLTNVRRGLAFIRAGRACGEQTFVHCKAGQGRSAILVTCYLLDAYRLDSIQAMRRLRAVRPHVIRRLESRDPIPEFAACRASGWVTPAQHSSPMANG